MKYPLALVLHYDLSSAGGLSTFLVHSDDSIALLGRAATKLQSRALQIDRVGFRVTLRHHQLVHLARMLLVHSLLLLNVQMRLLGRVDSLCLVDSSDFIR